jgi:homoserine acetyltransferase
LYTIKALQLFTVGQASTVDEGMQKIRAKALLIPIHSDLLVRETSMKRDADLLTAHGVQVRWFPIDGGFGHLEGRFGIAKAGDAIREFISQ